MFQPVRRSSLLPAVCPALLFAAGACGPAYVPVDREVAEACIRLEARRLQQAEQPGGFPVRQRLFWQPPPRTASGLVEVPYWLDDGRWVARCAAGESERVPVAQADPAVQAVLGVSKTWIRLGDPPPPPVPPPA